MKTIRVLVVDSDPTSRALHRSVLEALAPELSLSFVTTYDAISGARIFEGLDRFDLLITGGLFRAGPTGVEFAKALRAQQADLGVIFLSTDTGCVGAAAAAGFAAMKKPYDQDRFVAVVRELLAQKPQPAKV
ncbi:hypothetical protein ACFL0L_02975 [Patescibacteria group bacterium]